MVQQVKEINIVNVSRSGHCCAMGSTPGPRNFHMPWAWPNKKLKKKITATKPFPFSDSLLPDILG